MAHESITSPLPRRRVLVIGSGGREHALCQALSRAPSVASVSIAPGNGGTVGSGFQGGAPIDRLRLDAIEPGLIVDLARRERADLVVLGPEVALCAGAVDALEAAGILAFGPRRDAAILEGSKAYLKRFCTRFGIPTAPYSIVTTYDEACAVIGRHGAPIVVKADGLCAGKGVVVAMTTAEACEAAHGMLVEKRFGPAGQTVILEDVIRGQEASIHVITDGERLLVLPPARDHKRVGDGDVGPNTGGMGAIAPAETPTVETLSRIEREILIPTIDGMRAEGHPFRGVLFAGVMITDEGDPLLLEHNVRFGDPECQVLLGLLEGDLAELFASVARGAMDPAAVRVATDRHAVTVVMAAAGYPTSPRLGDAVRGIPEAERVEGVSVYHAGTAEQGGVLVTSGGRVLAVTATGDAFEEARQRAYRGVDAIDFDGKHFRRDIGTYRGTGGQGALQQAPEAGRKV